MSLLYNGVLSLVWSIHLRMRNDEKQEQPNNYVKMRISNNETTYLACLVDLQACDFAKLFDHTHAEELKGHSENLKSAMSSGLLNCLRVGVYAIFGRMT